MFRESEQLSSVFVHDSQDQQEQTCFPLSRKKMLRGNFFVCRVFSTKSVQNLKSFWRTSEIRFICALLYSLLTELHF